MTGYMYENGGSACASYGPIFNGTNYLNAYLDSSAGGTLHTGSFVTLRSLSQLPARIVEQLLFDMFNPALNGMSNTGTRPVITF